MRSARWGALNPCTGHRVVTANRGCTQEAFMDSLRALRHAYPGRAILLLLDRASYHTAQKSQALAARLGIDLL